MVRAAASGQANSLVNRAGAGSGTVGKPTGPTGTLGRRKAGTAQSFLSQTEYACH